MQAFHLGKYDIASDSWDGGVAAYLPTPHFDERGVVQAPVLIQAQTIAELKDKMNKAMNERQRHTS